MSSFIRFTIIHSLVENNHEILREAPGIGSCSIHGYSYSILIPIQSWEGWGGGTPRADMSNPPQHCFPASVSSPQWPEHLPTAYPSCHVI